ncbi:hypothetical protein EJ05DRAFT_46655 [Pseudovirgaria hyperparasitica]|uniref:N-acetyltransferase domain-containing protein n=1 Tax=Pseudovirgaria hyperparasitica TaxID=470096 RepID=A0A6A6W408_9PEZI|nr:uncharacterized protein EJ05DRAFT_46655 [Pseudovirgaria hyperparasitica]KAF2756899.1 hypothetical protein EJ05DRAFT_46655 [Pseudovirgaria hyperparasitica]
MAQQPGWIPPHLRVIQAAQQARKEQEKLSQSIPSHLRDKPSNDYGVPVAVKVPPVRAHQATTSKFVPPHLRKKIHNDHGNSVTAETNSLPIPVATEMQSSQSIQPLLASNCPNHGLTAPPTNSAPSVQVAEKPQPSGYIPPHLRHKARQAAVKTPALAAEPPVQRKKWVIEPLRNKSPSPVTSSVPPLAPEPDSVSPSPESATSPSQLPPHLRYTTQQGAIKTTAPVVKPPVQRKKWVDEPLYNNTTPSRTRPPMRHPLSPKREPGTSSSVEQLASNKTSAKKTGTTALTSPTQHKTVNLDAVYRGWANRRSEEKKQPVHVKKTAREKRGWPKNPRPRVKTPDSNAWGSGDWEKPNPGGVEIEVHGGQDPDYDIRQLTDWNGDWLPAPVEWENRRGFRHRGGNFSQWMHTWGTDHANNHKVAVIPLYPHDGPVVHPDWFPKVIDEQSPQTFWDSFCRSAPEPTWEEDLAWKPWWLTIIDGIFIPTPEQPSDKMSPEEELDYAQNNTFGLHSDGAAEWYATKEKLKHIEKKKKRAEMKEKRKESMELLKTYQIQVPDRSIKPELNIYLRPMKASDIPQVTKIYNWHQEHSVSPPEVDPVPLRIMQDRIASIEQAHFPLIVAVEKVASKKSRYGEFALTENIAGYAYVDDYHSRAGMHRYTGEIDVYVRHDCRRKLVGTCLMDKLMSLVDPGFDERGGYDWRSGEDSTGQYMRGGRRMMGKMMIRVGYFDGDVPGYERAEKFLNQFNFTICGNEEKVGAKDGRFTNVAPFQYTTSYITTNLLNPTY